jgi:ribosomal protein L5
MSSNDTINRFQQHYENVLVHDLASKLSISNSLEIPSIKKIIISSSVNFVPKQTRGMIQESYSIKRSTKKGSRAGESAFPSKAGSRNNEKKHTEGTRSAGREVRSPQILDIPSQVRSAFILITGQKPEERIFRVSRPGLNIRAGRLAALQVTLRRKSIYHFLDRLVTEILPNLKTDLTKPKDPARKTGVIFPYRQSSSPSS